MTSGHSPESALEYLAGLSPDVREGVVLDSRGGRLAGSPALAGPARDLLEASDAAQIEVVTGRGVVFAARSESHALAVVTGRFALRALVLYDLRAVLSNLSLS